MFSKKKKPAKRLQRFRISASFCSTAGPPEIRFVVNTAGDITCSQGTSFENISDFSNKSIFFQRPHILFNINLNRCMIECFQNRLSFVVLVDNDTLFRYQIRIRYCGLYQFVTVIWYPLWSLTLIIFVVN